MTQTLEVLRHDDDKYLDVVGSFFLIKTISKPAKCAIPRYFNDNFFILFETCHKNNSKFWWFFTGLLLITSL